MVLHMVASLAQPDRNDLRALDSARGAWTMIVSPTAAVKSALAASGVKRFAPAAHYSSERIEVVPNGKTSIFAEDVTAPARRHRHRDPPLRRGGGGRSAGAVARVGRQLRHPGRDRRRQLRTDASDREHRRERGHA